MPISGVGCLEPPEEHPAGFSQVPERFWAPHLSWSSMAGFVPDGPVADGGHQFHHWTLTARTLGDVQVRLLTDSQTTPLAQRIIDSARTFETDQNGCDATSPVQAVKFKRPRPGFDVTETELVESISVCEYLRSVPVGKPALTGSRLIEGDGAADLLTAIQRSPVGGGPDRPDNCVKDMYGDVAIALRLHDGDATRDLYVYYDWCFGNGIDDGMTRRELTRGSCLPLWSPPVSMFSGSTVVFSRCHE